MSAIYILWLRQLKRYVRSRAANYGFARPAAAVPAGAGVRVRADIPESRARAATFSSWRRA